MKSISQWMIVILLVVVIGVSCNDDASDPVNPGQIQNIRTETAISSEFAAAKESRAFQVNIPQPGDYRLAYTTTPGNFEVLFRLTEPALLIAQLAKGEEVYEVSLQKGTIRDSSASLTQAIELFDSAVFEMDRSFGTMVFITGGTLAAPTPTPTATPTPRATPTTTPLVIVPTPEPVDPGTLPHPTPTGKQTVIAAVGDSITYGYGSAVGGYPTMLESMFVNDGYDVIVYNKGVPGEKSPSTRSRFLSAIRGAQIVLLMIGTNDIINPRTCPGDDCHTRSNIAAMLDLAIGAGVTPVLSTIPPAHSGSEYDWANEDIEEINAQISREASRRGVIVLDTYEMILSHGGNSLFVDKLHFNDKGYKLLAQSWYKALTRNGLVK
ncbi:MAG: SGNH/GDSL hydrolase family protein [Candidatus Vecturithrix sp.]|jgi:lysophospholipase L1-like esterase|nr:SGNH/GDSL hydrolase family protein [Candidatus Vecturithrix sp.]